MRPFGNGDRIWIFCVCMLAIVVGCDTERNVEDPDLHFFVKYYGRDGNQEGVDMLALNDGSLLLLGNSSAGDNIVYVVRVDAEGEVIWESTFNEGSISHARDIEPTNDGNFVILCDIQDDDSLSQVMLLKIAPDGTVMNSVVAGTKLNDFGTTVTPLDNGHFIVSGTTELTDAPIISSPDPDFGDFINYRFDENLNEITDPSVWSPVVVGFGGKLDVAVKVLQVPEEIRLNDTTKRNQHYYVFGYSNTNINNNNTNNKLGLLYCSRDATGTEANGYFAGNNLTVDRQIHFVHQVGPELGGGYLVVGSSQDNSNNSEIYVAKLRNELFFDIGEDEIWSKAIQLNRRITGVSASTSVTGAFGYLIVGNEVRGTGARNIWLSKMDQSAAVLWSSTFGSEAGDDYAAAVKELPDGKIVVLGTMGLADTQSKMALIKVNPTGKLLK